MSHPEVDTYGRVLEQADLLARLKTASADLALEHKARLYFEEMFEKDASVEETIQGLLDMGMDEEKIAGFIRSAIGGLARFGKNRIVGNKYSLKSSFKNLPARAKQVGPELKSWTSGKMLGMGAGLSMLMEGPWQGLKSFVGVGSSAMKPMSSLTPAPAFARTASLDDWSPPLQSDLLSKEAELASWFGFQSPSTIPPAKEASADGGLRPGVEIWHETFDKVSSALEEEGREKLAHDELYALCDAVSKVAADAGLIVTASSIYNLVEEPTFDGFQEALRKHAFLKQIMGMTMRGARRVMPRGRALARGRKQIQGRLQAAESSVRRIQGKATAFPGSERGPAPGLAEAEKNLARARRAQTAHSKAEGDYYRTRRPSSAIQRRLQGSTKPIAPGSAAGRARARVDRAFGGGGTRSAAPPKETGPKKSVPDQAQAMRARKGRQAPAAPAASAPAAPTKTVTPGATKAPAGAPKVQRESALQAATGKSTAQVKPPTGQTVQSADPNVLESVRPSAAPAAPAAPQRNPAAVGASPEAARQAGAAQRQSSRGATTQTAPTNGARRPKKTKEDRLGSALTYGALGVGAGMALSNN